MNSRKRTAATQEAAWIADEDAFVLRQAYNKAHIRVKEGRAEPIDRLAVTLQFVDDTRDPVDGDVAESDPEVVEPQSLIESLDQRQTQELLKDMDVYISLEQVEVTGLKRDFWRAACSVCKDRLQETSSSKTQSRGAPSVSADVSKIFQSKSYDELVALEKQIQSKLQSNQPMDVDYWQSLLTGVTLFKSRAKLRTVTEQALSLQLQRMRDEQAESARKVRAQLKPTPSTTATPVPNTGSTHKWNERVPLDPESLLKVPKSCKGLPIVEEVAWLSHVSLERGNILKRGYISRKKPVRQDASADRGHGSRLQPAVRQIEAGPQSSVKLLEQQVAQNSEEGEEAFADEADLSGQAHRQETDLSRDRKPRYFNRVIMGYEWNKYNQTHYDQDNPPPKVVQGYKFNIFYPDLVDKSKGPTFKIIREHGRRRGQMSARAGDDDTCIIRFIAGPPYQDVAFRIVDREWDYSAKHERGFRSTFEGSVLQLHFQFRRMFYRK